MIFHHLHYEKEKKKCTGFLKKNKKKQGEPPTRLFFQRFVDIMIKKKEVGIVRERERE